MRKSHDGLGNPGVDDLAVVAPDLDRRQGLKYRLYLGQECPVLCDSEARKADHRPMSVTLLAKALVALLPAGMLFLGSIVLFVRRKAVPTFLQVTGAGCLLVVVLTHVAEALHLFPWMHWGLEHSVGHYLDFWSAIFGFTLFP